MNPAPVSVSKNPALPAVVEVEESAVSAGVGFCGVVTVNVCGEDVPPPGAGVTTVTGTIPAVAISVAGTTAVISPAETKVVTSGTPFQSTTEEAEKSEPAAVNVNCELPAVDDAGLIEVRTGAAFVMSAVVVG
jgi:hypothetical protein